MVLAMRRIPLRFLALGAAIAAASTVGLAQAAASPAAHHGPAQVQPLDHFLCYTTVATSASTGFKPVKGTRLVNQFTPNGIVPVIGKKAVLHCNPAFKYINGRLVSEPANPESHLLCLPLSKVPEQPTFTVHVTNQFGAGNLVATQPTRFCLPTWKSLTGPPVEPTPDPPNLYHFTCYPVTYAAGSTKFKPPGKVSVSDEFDPAGAAPVPVTIGGPKLLCLPTTKILPSGQSYPADLQGLHLLCFTVSKTPVISPVYDLNQFGESAVGIEATKYLCLPSEKTVISSTG